MCLQFSNIHRNNDSSTQSNLTSSTTHLIICSNLLIEPSNQLPFFNREEAQFPSGRYHGPIKDELRWNVHNYSSSVYLFFDPEEERLQFTQSRNCCCAARQFWECMAHRGYESLSYPLRSVIRFPTFDM
ncbi:hypothetical protein DdX_06383 [Ditylenchus destructor]|uniref:Uncharacterized protein n=1 Tax=Ditylenchus destructor TaxID=166010 RepID=A0AAD4N916_9BILA|nr:hypothetical protein DdX_06383 [Ditylenchus destructor]